MTLNLTVRPETTPGWLDWHPSPSRPRVPLPAGAVDAHCHVFGPAAEFPFAPERKYTPCDAGKRELFALRDRLGFARQVIVQASCHGADNRALVDALQASNGRARGIATVRADVSDAELLALHEAGVRGLRFNFLKRLVDDFTPREQLQAIASRIAPLGWHVVVYFEAADLPALWDFFTGLPLPVIVDHMGRPEVGQGVDGPLFARFLRLLREQPNVWTKLSCPERLSQSVPPDYEDVTPFARALLAEFPDRVLWGTDWPHPNLKGHMPDDGQLVDWAMALCGDDAERRQRLFVSNPMRLYWPEDAVL